TSSKACTFQRRPGLLLFVDIPWFSAPGVSCLTGNRRLCPNSCRCVYLPSIPSELVADNTGGISTHCLSSKTLLCPSSRLQDLVLSVEDSEDSAGDIAFQTASDFSIGFVFGLPFCNIGAGFSIMSHLADGDHM